MNTKTFKGAKVFISRNLVPPEIFDALHDALKHNGAEVFLCCDPSRNGPKDYHVISSPDHEKFKDLRAKGCNLLGPQCVLSCSKEHRLLPSQGFTCCLAMDGVKVLASGFQGDEKVKIGELVTAMGGVLHTKASLDVSFVIVNNVLAAKYKWALNVLKKPIVTVGWLYQCWNEHRVVPHESYKVLPFSGLMISVSRIPADERKEIEKLIMQNGGKYSADLTKKCTHLICNAPEGDKYKVARTWGHINIVTRRWFDQSIARRACLNEESFPVLGSLSSNKVARGSLGTQHSLEKVIGNFHSAPSSFVADSNFSAVSCPGIADSDLEATLSQNTCTKSDVPPFVEGFDELPITLSKSELNVDGCVTNDSQSEDNELYLSACKILLVGFEVSEMRKLVNMVRKGGGSRYMLFNDRLTHIIVGTPSEPEKKEVRDVAALGVIHVVRTTWLEDCDHAKKEIPVLRRHMAFDVLIPKGSNKAVGGIMNVNQGTVSVGMPSLEKKVEEKLEVNVNGDGILDATILSEQSQSHVINGKKQGRLKMPHDSVVPNEKSSRVFKGKTFRFSDSFPEDRRAEIVQWVSQGGGEVVHENVNSNVHFTIECHGVLLRNAKVPQTTYVSSHWIRSCLEDCRLLDVNRNILYSPLPCRIPLPGFEKFRFCISQYEDKDRILLRNLCFVLGAKFVEKLTKKVTHLICKFTNGPKYEAACKWGIKPITPEWIYECVSQNKVVALDSYCPKEVTAQDQEAGLCTVSQFPTQAVRMISGDSPSQFPSQSQDLRDRLTETKSFIGDDEQSGFPTKRARLFEDGIKRAPSGQILVNPVCALNSSRDLTSKSCSEVIVPDVAAAIEDLLEQTSKIHDQMSPGRTGCDKSIFSADCSILGQDNSDAHSVIGLSKHWLNRSIPVGFVILKTTIQISDYLWCTGRFYFSSLSSPSWNRQAFMQKTERKDNISNPSGDGSAGLYDGFSETQTDSQVVGYEEDLSGRQMLIDRVRTRSSMT